MAEVSAEYKKAFEDAKQAQGRVTQLEEELEAARKDLEMKRALWRKQRDLLK